MKKLTIDIDKIEIKPISDESDFEVANELINQLVDADMLEDLQQKEKALLILDAITTLAVEYERKHHPIPNPDPIEAIKERMEMLNLSQKDVANYFGGANRASEVLSRKRRLTLGMIQNLYKGLGIPAEILIMS